MWWSVSWFDSDSVFFVSSSFLSLFASVNALSNQKINVVLLFYLDILFSPLTFDYIIFFSSVFENVITVALQSAFRLEIY